MMCNHLAKYLKYKTILFYSVFFSLSALQSAFGQVSDTSTLTEAGSPEPIWVLSPAGSMQKITEAPALVSLVSNDLTQKYGWLSVNEILYSLPGFAPSQDYDRRTVSFRGVFEGWNKNHILTLVDGIPFNDNLYGSAYTWENSPLVFTKSYEISRGPGGSLYGGNAINGTVAANTLEATDLDGIARVRLRAGSNKTLITDFLTGTENKSAGIVASFTRFYTGGNEYESYDLSGRTRTNAGLEKFKIRDEQDNSYFFAKAYGKGKYKGLSLQYHEQHWEFQTGHGWLFSVPDQPESMNEYRRVLAFKYSPGREGKRFNYEALARYQDHGVHWNMRFFPDRSTAYGLDFPNGVSESLKTGAKDFFIRFQGTYSLDSSKFLFGLDGDRFYYRGDVFHTANMDLNTFTAPDSSNRTYTLNPWMEYILDKPVHHAAAFVRYVSPMWFDKLQLILGGRYEHRFFNYTDIQSAGRPIRHKSFNLFAPHASLTFHAGDLVLKAMAGRSLRSPSPTEMFGANTFTLASNIKELEPEILTNFDLGLDWKWSESLRFGLNGFLFHFENQIAYSVANANLSTNIYSLKTAGLEAELHFTGNRLSGFFNYSFSKRLDESISDSTVAISRKKLTWAPAHMANLGMVYSIPKFYAAIGTHFQGEVARRSSDILEAFEGYRPAAVSSWVNLDAKVAYKLNPSVEIGLSAKNITGQGQYLVKNNAAPFDYRREGRRVFMDLSFRF
ncbi:MAG TPA: TonB-dependent receptor [Saprospiraceae bacterium]|nr:TonB-dependent receptor [Saprospiraceae bacterium]HNT20773.1 TonB-dependent receptor [Saprospiraceae bacterium]